MLLHIDGETRHPAASGWKEIDGGGLGPVLVVPPSLRPRARAMLVSGPAVAMEGSWAGGPA